ALSALLLVGAGLLGRSFLAAVNVDPGFRPERVATILLYVYGYNYQNAEAQRGYVRDYLERIRSIPGVESAGVVTGLPLTDFGAALAPVTIVGRPEPEPEPIDVFLVDGDYFETMGIPLRRGRLLNDFDRTETEKVALINATAALRFFPGEDPVGRMLSTGQTISGPVDDPTTARIVGVVGDVPYRSLEERPSPAVYFSHRQVATGTLNFVARTALDPAAVVLAMQDAAFEVDPEYPVSRAATMSSLVTDSTADRSFYTTLLLAFAAVALVLASVGLYGVSSYFVAERRKEMGVRLAMGASGGDLLRLVFGRGARLVALGLAIGLTASLALGRLASGLLFGVGAQDPLTFAIVAAVLVCVSALATLVPALRASRLDPLVALGDE
ncbi:MAG TPA: FtsX-like permease family protein, partial [Vicinamibacteria bacterium]